MWSHANNFHQGVIGEGGGMLDYKFTLLGTHRDNMSRQVHEGYRQLKLENFQSQNKLVCLNSKIDYVQPLMTKLTVASGNSNIQPGSSCQTQPASAKRIRVSTSTPVTSSQYDKELTPVQGSALGPANSRFSKTKQAEAELSSTQNDNLPVCSKEALKETIYTHIQNHRKRKFELSFAQQTKRPRFQSPEDQDPGPVN